jgi:hypothetical protein
LHENVEEISKLLEILPFISPLNLQLMVDPLFLPTDAHIYSGLIFQLLLVEEKKRLVFLANGGCYKKLIDSHRLPSDFDRSVSACNISFQHQQFLPLLSVTRGSPEIILYSNSPRPFSEVAALVGQVWNANFRIHTSFCNQGVTNEEAASYARNHKIAITIQMRDGVHRGRFGKCRVRNLDKRQEWDVPVGEIADHLQSLIREASIVDNSDDSNGAALNSLGQSVTMQSANAVNPLPINVTFFTPQSKVKMIQKNVVIEKTMRAFAPVISAFAQGKAANVVALDLNRDVVRKVIDTLGENEIVLKQSIEAKLEHEGAIKLRSTLSGIHGKENNNPLYVYNYREGWIIFVQ